MNLPIVSIIVAAFNAENYLPRAVNSVLQQDFENWELLIVNDGSTDQTTEILNQFKDQRIQVIHQENEGVSSARNRGLERMQGQYFCFLDADDALTPQSLSSRVQIFESRKELDFVDGLVQIMDEELQEKLAIRHQTFEGQPLEALLQIDNTCFFGPTWMIRRDPSRDYRFKSGLTHGEDLLFYMDLSQSGGQYTATQEPVYQYRKGNTSAMSNLDGLWQGYQAIYRELQDNFQLSNRQLSSFKRKITSIMFKSFLGHCRPVSAMKVLVDYFRP